MGILRTSSITASHTRPVPSWLLKQIKGQIKYVSSLFYQINYLSLNLNQINVRIKYQGSCLYQIKVQIKHLEVFLIISSSIMGSNIYKIRQIEYNILIFKFLTHQWNIQQIFWLRNLLLRTVGWFICPLHLFKGRF